MYQSSSSSSSSTSHSSVGQVFSNNGGLKRYDSAPGSFLTATVDSIIGQPPRSKELSPLGAHRYSESSCEDQNQHQNLSMMMRSFAASSNSSPLVRHTSLPAGFLNPPPSASTSDNVTRNYNFHGGSDSANGIQRLNSQLSFTRQDSLSQITEESEDADEDIHADGHRKASHAFATDSYGMGWDNSNTIMFSGGTGKRAKNDSVSGLGMSESQFQFGLSQTALDMASMEQMMDIPHDSVPCKARAKRGCATHPRSIAERERRTRISGKLKKLQDLVPNMDKQTSYADMLDLAVQHIKGLQTQVQKLNTDLEHCTCGCKKNGQCNQ